MHKVKNKEQLWLYMKMKRKTLVSEECYQVQLSHHFFSHVKRVFLSALLLT